MEYGSDKRGKKYSIVVNRKPSTATLDTVVKSGKSEERIDSFFLVRASPYFQNEIKKQKKAGKRNYEISLKPDREISKKSLQVFLKLLSGFNQQTERSTIEDILILATITQVCWLEFFIQNIKNNDFIKKSEATTVEELYEEMLNGESRADPYIAFCEAKEKFGSYAYIIFDLDYCKLDEETIGKIIGDSMKATLINSLTQKIREKKYPQKMAEKSGKFNDEDNKKVCNLLANRIDIFEPYSESTDLNVIVQKLDNDSKKTYEFNNKFNRTPICYAALFNDEKQFNKLYSMECNNFNKDVFPELICCASISGNFRIFENALDLGKNINIRTVHDHSRKNPLHYTLLFDKRLGEYIRISKVLIEMGVSLFDKDEDQTMPINLLFGKDSDEIKEIFDGLKITVTVAPTKKGTKNPKRAKNLDDSAENSDFFVDKIIDLADDDKKNYEEAIVCFDVAMKLNMGKSVFKNVISRMFGDKEIIEILVENYYSKDDKDDKAKFIMEFVCKFDEDKSFIDDKIDETSTILNFLAKRPGNGKEIKQAFDWSSEKIEMLLSEDAIDNSYPITQAISVPNNDENVEAILSCMKELNKTINFKGLLAKIVENGSYSYLNLFYDILWNTKVYKDKEKYETDAFVEALQTNKEKPLKIIYDHTKQSLLKAFYEIREDNSKINNQDSQGTTTLMMAVKENNEILVKELLKYGPDLSITDSSEYTAEDYAEQCKKRSIDQEIKEYKRQNTKQKAKVSYQIYNLESIKENDAKAIVSSDDFDADMQCKDGKTPTIIFAIRGIKSVVEALINKGADLGRKDSKGKTAAFYAVQNGKLEIAKMILSKWKPRIEECSEMVLDASQKQAAILPFLYEQFGNYYNSEELFIIFSAESPEMGNTPLHYASQKGYKHHIDFLLETFNLDINKRNNKGQTPLHLAAIANKVVSVESLIQRQGIDPDAMDCHNKTPLYSAAEGGFDEVVKALLTSKSIDINLGMKNAHGVKTPLLRAVFSGKLKIVEILLDDPRIDPEVKYQKKNVQENIEVAKIDNKEEMRLLFNNYYQRKQLTIT